LTLLIDTMVMILLGRDPGRLRRSTLAVLSDPETSVALSVASAWEIAIKTHQGRLELPAPAPQYIDERVLRFGFTVMPIHLQHVYVAGSLESIHKDPFDRLLIAQAMVERVPVVTSDAVFARYGVEVIPA
jgi:PIN domain nuclease of toxin-antitoxin system